MSETEQSNRVHEISRAAQQWCNENFGRVMDNVYNAGYEGFVHGHLAGGAEKDEEIARLKSRNKEITEALLDSYTDEYVEGLKSKLTASEALCGELAQALRDIGDQNIFPHNPEVAMTAQNALSKYEDKSK